MLAANTAAGWKDDFFDVGLHVRKPKGVLQLVDNTFLFLGEIGPLPQAGYDTWEAGWGLENSSKTNNFYEYAFNGDPTNPLDIGINPALKMFNGTMYYSHIQRNDDTGLVYSVEISTNLITGSWMDAGGTEAATNSMGGGLFYDAVRHTIPTVLDEQFIRLKVSTP